MSITLYRFYSPENELLYVGITSSPPHRFKQHSTDKPWWTDAGHVTFEHHPDRPSALAAEKQAILTEHPRWNIHHNGHIPAGPPTERATMATTDRPDRLTQAATDKLRSDSLVGSFFLANAERGWQGCVIAEPAPGIYLLEMFEWFTGASSNQMLIKLDEMTDWRFYDTADWMTSHYEHYVSSRWEHERADGEVPA